MIHSRVYHVQWTHMVNIIDTTVSVTWVSVPSLTKSLSHMGLGVETIHCHMHHIWFTRIVHIKDTTVPTVTWVEVPSVTKSLSHSHIDTHGTRSANDTHMVHMTDMIITYFHMSGCSYHQIWDYGVATISRLLKIIDLFCRMLSLL